MIVQLGNRFHDSKMYKLILVFISLLFYTNAYRILVVYPIPLLSHQRTPQAVIRGLLSAGHEVVYLSPLPFHITHPKLRVIDIGSSTALDETGDLMKEVAVKDLSSSEILVEWLHFAQMGLEGMFSLTAVQQLMRNEKFDAVIVENLHTTPIYALPVHFNCTAIGLVSFETQPSIYREMGNPTHPIIHAGMMTAVPINPNIWQRLKAFYQFFEVEKVIYFKYWATMNSRMKEWFPDLDVNSIELIRNFDLHIEAVSPIFNLRPLLPNTIQIGFIHIEPPKPLESELLNFLDSAQNGAIYVSFGSTVQGVTMGPHLLNVLIEVLGSLPYKVIWKFEKEIPVPKNVKIMKWTPQADLLAHRNIKLFITQGGHQSIEESVSNGVPFVVIPFFADQSLNAFKVAKFGWGKFILREDVTVDSLKSLVHEVVTNKVYKENVQSARDLMLDTPMKPVETAVWWIEYAIRHRGDKNLKYHDVDMPYYQYFFIDIVAVHVLCFVFLKYSLQIILVWFQRRKLKIE